MAEGGQGPAGRRSELRFNRHRLEREAANRRWNEAPREEDWRPSRLYEPREEYGGLNVLWHWRAILSGAVGLFVLVMAIGGQAGFGWW